MTAFRYLDPEEPLAGRCMTCKNVVMCLCRDVDASRRGVHRPWGVVYEPGTWADLLSVECPCCEARVFVMSAGEFEKVVAQ